MAKSTPSSHKSGLPPPKVGDTQPESVPNDERMVQIGKRIKDAREKLGLSQHALGIRLGGLTGGAVFQWEAGNNAPKMKTFYDLAKELQVTDTWLLTGYEHTDQAQDVIERDLLKMARERSPAAKLAAMALLESWGDKEISDPSVITSVIGALVQLEPEDRSTALSMIDILGREGTQESKSSVRTLLQAWREMDKGDTAIFASTIEELVRLAPEDRSAALAMIGGLSRRSQASAKPQLPQTPKSPQRTKRGRAVGPSTDGTPPKVAMTGL